MMRIETLATWACRWRVLLFSIVLIATSAEKETVRRTKGTNALGTQSKKAWKNGRTSSHGKRKETDKSLMRALNNYYNQENEGEDEDVSDAVCSEYLVSFLEGTTDAKDNCEGIQNAYLGAQCGYSNSDNGLTMTADDDNDDYFSNFHHFSCCQSLKARYDEYCENDDLITNMHLLLIASVLLLCEMAKSLIKKHEIHFLPEAGGCVIVGTLVGFIAHFLPNFDIDDLSFDEDLFLCVLLPPIIFEAALSVNKREFRRRRLAILMFAVVGTVLSTFMTGYMVHYSSSWFESSPTIPMLDSFIFGALISSIDPVAILSVLTSLNLTETDTIFIMVFGESLLNDGIAITMFKALVVHYKSEEVGVSTDEILGFIADFLIVFFGSTVLGIICGFACLIYFWFLRKKLNAAMEVASFILWAGIPYYICDGIGWSGIVSIVTMGFFMDIYIAAPKPIPPMEAGSSRTMNNKPASTHTNYVDLGDSIPCSADVLCGAPNSPSARSLYSLRSLRTLNMRELLLREERFRLSAEADKHVRFVAHLLAQLSENAIFVYLGLFLFSKNYKWDVPLVSISIISCILSRAMMVMIICLLVWHINVCRNRFGYKSNGETWDLEFETDPSRLQVSRTATALQNRKIQVVLVLAGLRGAVSLALMENVPIYNGVTDEGSEFKPEMKAMTSAAILFTMFVFGGSAYYILRKLDISSEHDLPLPPVNLQELPPRQYPRSITNPGRKAYVPEIT